LKALLLSSIFFSQLIPLLDADPLPPVAVQDVYSVRAGSILEVNALNGVLSNDYDPNNDPITVGSFVPPDQGKLLTFLTDGSFSFKAPAGFVGIAVFQYRVWDGREYSPFTTATVHVIENLNQAPIAVSEEYQTPANVVFSMEAPGVLVNDYDPDADSISVVSYIPPLHGIITRFLSNGAFTYNPHSNFSGTDAFWYRISDGSAESEFEPIVIRVGSSSGTDISVNGSFDVADRFPESAEKWKGRQLSGEQRVCNEINSRVAFHGHCAFQFTGGPGERSKLLQLNPLNSNLTEGSFLRLEAFVRADFAVHGAIIKAIIWYKGNNEQEILKMRIPPGTYPYTPLQSETIRLRSDVGMVKIQISNHMTSGSFRIDKVGLLVTEGE
jgi:hypothetical protein